MRYSGTDSPILSHYITDLHNLQQAVSFIRTMLSPLIHPLSHYSDNEVYRSELIELDQNVALLANELEKVDLNSNSKILLEKGMFVKFTYEGDSPWHFEYRYKLKENILIYKDDVDSTTLSLGELDIYSMEGIDGISKPCYKKIGKKSTLFSLLKGKSLEERANKIFAYIDSRFPSAHFVFDAVNFVNCITFQDENNNWKDLSEKVNQIHFRA